MRHQNLTAAARVAMARRADRPSAREYIDAMIEDFFPQHGDRLHGEDESVLGGVGFFHGRPVTVIAQQKGSSLEENLACRFGMPNPEGYRKAVRLMKQAEKFSRPVITFVDTPGAYPGVEAEAGGQGEAIARSIACMAGLKVPEVAVFIGEGGSGGALALGTADRIIMLENSIFSILSPEGFASILWKDAKRSDEAAEVMKLTAEDLWELGICDVVISEGAEGAHAAREYVFDRVEREIEAALCALEKKSAGALAEERYRKLRRIGDKKKTERKDHGRSETFRTGKSQR
ncbi:acetyl-CoA carboxylase carboxyltransferase subunit alpha [Ihubacter sp. mB4P-1]|uniref:acetyl-CoA carboxylase carboxyltransferase subunit alpha n=1 Tax=Ihubacter sp. mB4P-1 TaxID=3242370 RepID=UPI00137ABE51